MQKNTEHSTITVPIPDHKEILIGTFDSIIRQSQVSYTRFEVES
jgi:predicted RNA binding protein YcfA (HicA-like mRNA interferase family)